MRKLLLLLGLVLLFVGCPKTETNAAKIYLEKGMYKEAKEQIMSGLKIYPKDYELYCLLAKAEIGLGNSLDASKAFIEAINIDSLKTLQFIFKDKNNTSVYWQSFYNAALTLTSEKKHNDALKNLVLCEAIDPKNVNIYILEGRIYADMGNKEKAMRGYQKALIFDPETSEAYFLIAVTHFDNKSYDSTLAYLEGAIKYYQNEYDKVKKVVFQNVDFNKALCHELIELWNQKNNNELDKLIKVKLGIDGGLNAQSRNIERLAKITDGLARSYYYSGITSYNLKNDSLAIKNLMISLDYTPKDIDALFFTGEILLRQQKYNEAKDYLTKITEINRNDFAAWFYLAVCYTQLKDYRKAISIYEEEVLRIDPKSIDAMNNLAFCYREIGNNKKALEYLIKVEQLQREKK